MKMTSLVAQHHFATKWCWAPLIIYHPRLDIQNDQGFITLGRISEKVVGVAKDVVIGLYDFVKRSHYPLEGGKSCEKHGLLTTRLSFAKQNLGGLLTIRATFNRD